MNLFVRKNLILYLIIIVAAALRLTMLDIYPYGFTPDEASFGYDAYSILKTGKDQWGEKLPLVLKSFGDYKPPLYSYLSIPSVAVLGLSKVSVRLTNAFFGVAAVFITYLLAGELGKLSKFSKGKTKKLQFVSSLLLAVSPWHVMMSRGAFEANLTTFLMPFGIYLFLRSFKDNKLLIASAFVFGLNLFSYHSARLVTPVLVVSLVFICWKKLNENKLRLRLYSIFIFGIFLSLAFYTLTIGGTERAKDISIYNGAAQAAAGDRLIALERGVPHLIAKGMHNKFVVTGERFIENYVQYSSYNFLFKNGPAEATYGMMPGNGVTYWFVIPFMLFFLFYLFKNSRDSSVWIIVAWLIFAPIPASMTTGEGYAANRAVIMLPALQLLLGYGAMQMFILIKKNLDTRFYKYVKIGFILIGIVSVLGFMEKYFILSPFKVADGMLHGRLEAAQATNQYFNPDEEVVVSTALSEPHIYIAFANKIDPKVYQSHSRTWNLEEYGVNWVDQIPEYRLERYVFKKIQWNDDSAIYSNFIGLPREFPENATPNIVFYYPNLEEAIYVINENINVYAYKDN